MTNKTSLTAIELRDISKTLWVPFSNKIFALQVPAGYIHGYWENGAESSTWWGMLYGLWTDTGHKVDGKRVDIRSSQDASMRV